MPTNPHRRPPGLLAKDFALLALVLGSSPVLLAQATAPAEKPKPEEEEIYVLSPFEVQASKDVGYTATSSLAGSRLNTQLRDVASAIQVITPEFIKDTGSTNLRDLLVYTTGTEVSGIGGNYYGGNADDNGYRDRMLTNPQSGTRVRGLDTADVTRSFFISGVPMDSYNIARVDIQRGPNSVLFGLGSPAGIINSTLKDANVNSREALVQVRYGSYGSHRQVIDGNLPLIKGSLGLRVAVLNDDAQYRQNLTFNHDKRLYGALRWQPKLASHVFTQLDVRGESGRIKANRPVSVTAADFISNWFGPLNRYVMYDPLTSNGIPQEPNRTGHRELSHYFSGAPARDWWNGSPATIYQNPDTAKIGNGSLDAYRQRDGSPWGGLSGVTNPNWDEGGLGSWNKNTAAYFANNPLVAGLIRDFESSTGKTFQGFGPAQWPTQLILSGPLAFIDQTMPGRNKSEWNDFDTIELSLTQTYLNGRLGFNVGYYKEYVLTGRTNLIGSNRVTVDVNATLRNGAANPDLGRPYIVSPSGGGITDVERESWRVQSFYKFDIAKHIGRDRLLSKIFGEQTFTGLVSSQREKSFGRSFNLYAWDAESVGIPTANSANHQAWWGLHYIGDNLSNVPSFGAIPESAIHPITASRVPAASQTALVYNSINKTWPNIQAGLLNWRDHLDQLYTGASENHHCTDSSVFIWQSKLFNDAFAGQFAWRRDKYESWAKGPVVRGKYNVPLPYSPDWNYSKSIPLLADEQRRSWGGVVHVNELLGIFGKRLPKGTGLSFTYNESNTFRPSSVAKTVYGDQIQSPTGETKDFGVIVSALDEKISLRLNWYKTTQKRTRLPSGPSLGWAKGGVVRTMNTLGQETWGSWSAGSSQTAPEWLVNKWFFGTSTNNAIASQPLPADWQSQQSTLMTQPLRIRRAAVPGSATYVAQGAINPDTNLPYLAPPLEADEVAYRKAWFAARTDAEWFRPLESKWVAAQQFAKAPSDYAIWGEGGAQGGLTNDLSSKGVEIELTANPLPNWRLTFNAARVEATRTNILPDWKAFVDTYKGLWFDGLDTPLDTTKLNYWTINGFADLRHWGGTQTYSGAADTFGGRMMQDVYGPYVNAMSGEGRSVNELRKWRVNFVTNYTFKGGRLNNVNVGGAVRWQDKTAIGYLPKYDREASIWITDVSKPFFGPSETDYDAWIGYSRKLTEKITWEVQLNVRNLFARDELIPIAANPDGTIAQARIPAETTWSLTNTFRF